MRKRAIICLGHLVMSCDQTLYIKLINMIMEELGKADMSTTRTYIQALGSICRQAGHRFGDHVERVMPLVMTYARREDDEMKEHVLQVLTDCWSWHFIVHFLQIVSCITLLGCGDYF